jgi:hypothetical protein
MPLHPGVQPQIPGPFGMRRRLATRRHSPSGTSRPRLRRCREELRAGKAKLDELKTQRDAAKAAVADVGLLAHVVDATEEEADATDA